VKHLGLWILGAAVGSFAAGMNVGLVVPGLVAACSKSPGLDAESGYLAQLVADYGLTQKQERSVRLVLEQCREEELAVFFSADASTLPPGMLKEILAARGRREQRIRAVLDAEQRARYDKDSRPK